MVGLIRIASGLTGAAVLLLGACTGSDSESPPSGTPSSSASSATSQAAVPTAEQLAAALVTAGDLAGTWSVNIPPNAQDAIDGVVSEQQRQLLPRIELCDAAGDGSRTAAERLRWQSFRQLDQSAENPIDPARGDRLGHMIFVQEFLAASDPAETESTFNALRNGMHACEGQIPAGEEGPGEAHAVLIAEVGDDRYGVLTTIEEAGGGARWLVYSSLVRQGPVLMALQVVDIVMGEPTEPAFTTGDIDTFLAVAVRKLPRS